MIELRDYQQEAHEATILHCRRSNEPAIHDQSVGAGKTLQIAFAVKHVVDKGGSVLVLARQGDLVEQDVEDYRMIGGKASVFSASLGFRSTYYPAIFGSEGTVARALQQEFKNKPFDFIAIDECHEVSDEEINDCLSYARDGKDIYSAKNENGKPLFSQYTTIITHFILLNKNVRIVGYSGSPFRGARNIVEENGFWKSKLSEVGTYELVSKGYLVPPSFGFPDEDCIYDTSKYEMSSNENGGDLSPKQLSNMQREILKEKELTQHITEYVVNRTQNRLGVLITCAGKAHCKEVAKYLPDGQWAIVTDDVSTKKRREILAKAKTGEYKYILQVNCLGQGVNVPIWDTCVIMRKIGSLRYLIQLIGRVLRLLKPEQIEQGLEKHDGLVLDFTDTMECAGEIYDNPITDNASAERAKKKGVLTECPICYTQNSEYAVRCRGEDSNSKDGRCEHFFKATTCLKCGTDNAPTAKQCRECHAILIDPNDALINKAYSDADYKKVLAMDIEPTKSGDGLCVTYHLASMYHKDGKEYPEKAKEYFKPFDSQQFNKGKWYKFIRDHIQGDKFRRMFAASRTINEMIQKKAMLDFPVEITHRMNGKGFSIINRKKFRSGREETAS